MRGERIEKGWGKIKKIGVFIQRNLSAEFEFESMVFCSYKSFEFNFSF